MRIVQISHTHLSRDKPLFVDNWAPLAALIADQHPDLVIHTGDVTVDGAGVEADLSFSAHLMDELGIRWRAVPGNHDVGDTRHAHQPVNTERLSAWQRHFGPDRWVEDVAEGAQRWRLVGFDVMLMGSGEPEEDEQARWLEQVMAEAGSGGLPGSCIGRYFLRIRAKATPVIGRSSRSRAGRFSRCCAGTGLPWSPADICTKREISP